MQQSEMEFVTAWLTRSAAATSAFATDAGTVALLGGIAEAIAGVLAAGGKLLLAGNGGSAADAQHIAAEFVSRMNYDRAPLAAVALTTDSSALTAIGNDYGFDLVFERQLRGLGRPGDALLGISTSGRSPNVLRALATARAGGLLTVGFTGAHPGPMAEHCDYLLCAPAEATAIIQQIHIIAAHIICSLVERALCPRGS
jgi:D-sedoheptulose 7-phosphate isomerase